MLNVEMPSDEVILEAMTMDGRLWEGMHHIFSFFPNWKLYRLNYQRNPWPQPSDRFYLRKYYA
jgi:hypothetical protein